MRVGGQSESLKRNVTTSDEVRLRNCNESMRTICICATRHR